MIYEVLISGCDGPLPVVPADTRAIHVPGGGSGRARSREPLLVPECVYTPRPAPVPVRALLLTVLAAALLYVLAAEVSTAEAVLPFPEYSRSGSGELLSDAECPRGLLLLESPRGNLVCLRKESAEKLLLRGFDPASRDALMELRWTVSLVADPAHGITAESNRFGVDLYKILARDGGNVFFSPIAVYLAFSALYEGAGGKTREQIRDVFGMDLDVEARRAAAVDLLSRLERDNPYAAMNMRSAMLIDDRFEVDEDYVELARAYGTHVETTDVSSPDLERKIDQWAGHATRGHITDIVDSNKTMDAASVMASPVYFDAEWQGRFPRDRITQFWFGDTMENDGLVETMHELCSCFYSRFIYNGIVVSWLQYRDSGLSMFVASQNYQQATPGNLETFEESLTAEEILGWSSKVYIVRDLNIYMPQFRSLYDTDLRDPLSELGLDDIFDAQSADLGGIGSGIYLDSIVQKGAMEVGWKGGVHPGKVFTNDFAHHFIAHPDLFFAIMDDSTGTILFMGRVSDPTTIFSPVFLR